MSSSIQVLDTDRIFSAWRQRNMDTQNDIADREAVTSDVIIDEDSEILKVSAHSRPSAVAGAIAAVIRNHGRADVQAIGAGATNQAIKAVAIARDYLQPNGIEIVVVPAFIDVTIADEERTAIRLVVESRNQ
jgi:stage V sporulation protein S